MSDWCSIEANLWRQRSKQNKVTKLDSSRTMDLEWLTEAIQAKIWAIEREEPAATSSQFVLHLFVFFFDNICRQ